MKATIKDVAKLAGVVPSTVTKVLKNYDNISDSTKEKVLAAVKELNYIPNFYASGLSSKNNTKVALYVYINDQKQAVDEINMQYILGAFSKSNALNIEIVTIFNQSVTHYTASELTGYLISQGINALIVCGLNKEDSTILSLIDEQKFFITVIDAPIHNTRTSSVMVDHKNGQYDVAEKLIAEDGCKKMLYLAGKKNGYVTDIRIDGIKKLQKKYKFQLDILHADFSEKKAYDITVSRGKNYDTIVCASDLMAIGVINALKHLNIYKKCCGYDGITLMAYVGQEVYTCRQDFYEIARCAVEEIAHLLDGDVGKAVLLPYEVTTLKYQDIIT